MIETAPENNPLPNVGQPSTALPDGVPAAAVRAPLGTQAARGVAWFIGQGLTTKVISTASQIALAWLLGKADYGFVAIAYSAAAFVGLLQQAGIWDILIQRSAHFRRWSAPAFWMSLTIGVSNGLLMILIAPLAGRFFHEPRIGGLLVVLGINNMVTSLGVVWEAKLQIGLKFKFLAYTGVAVTLASAGLSVVFAALHFGAYSFVLPMPIVSALRVGIVAYGARTRIRCNPHFRRWRFMLGDSGMLLATGFFANITLNGDYMILGRMYASDKNVVGVYFWAWNFSTQALQLLALNMGSVLFPSLSQLNNEPQRQLAGFTRAAKAISILAVPACFLQAALARPVVELVFKRDWVSGIPILQILSIGWALWVPSYAAQSMIKAQGRFREFLGLMAFSATLFLVLVFFGASSRAGVGAALGVATYSWLCGPLTVYLAIKPLGGKIRQVVEILAAPLCISVVAVGIGAAVAAYVPLWPKPWGQLVRIVVVLIAASLIYMPLIRAIQPTSWHDIIDKFRGMLRRSAK